MCAYIDISNLSKTYETPAGAFTALRGINIRFEQGELVAVIGKSGSGKTTFINCLSGIDFPSRGSIRIGDVRLETLNENQMADWRGRNLGVIFQFFQLLPTLTVVENIMLPLEITHSLPKKAWRSRAMQLLTKVGLQEQADKLPAALSGGQQQRVAIARALVNDPPLIIADEPTGNLDTKMAEEVFQLFRDLVNEGKTILMVTHDDDFARRVDRTILISDGQVVNEFLVGALKQLSKDLIIEVSASLEPIQISCGRPVFHQGEACDCFYIVLEGECEVIIQRPGGGEILLARRKVGEYFGETALIQAAPRNASVRAGEQGALLLPVTAAYFDRMMKESPGFRREMEHVAAARSRHLTGAEIPLS
jgi:ABC-type lipoprotein export system ATPase subunit